MMKVDAVWHLVHFWCTRHWLGMQARQSASLHRPIAFGFWLLSTLGAAAACSDDGNLLGSENSAGSAGAQAGSAGAQAGSAGAQAGSAGAQAGSAGAEASAGAPVVAGAGGSANEGGGLQGGEAGTPSGGAGGAGGGDCVGETCAANEACVAHRTVGGAMLPPDQNNQCMDGRHLEGSICQSDFMYACATLTGCSAPSGTCRCAAGTDCAGTTVCRLPAASAWLDTDAQLVCELLAP